MSIIGKILGNRYEILEEIGSGGMATVYKAKDKILNRFVALKVLKDEFANDVEFIKRFQVEAQSAASLSHPNIVSIYDVGFEDNLHYIVMELVDGKTLKDIIKERGKLPWREAVGIASQIASGLSQAHKNHIVHRDIKPHNILITKDGMAKVTDFGIAKAVTSSTINAFDSTLGSVHYFSPEHARGGYTDEKSDLYSLGVVLYEMCTGTLPFDAKTPVAIALMHINERPLQPIAICSDIPEGVNDIILKAMQKETSDRYASAQDMYKDLQKILNDPSIKVVEKVESSNSDFPTQRIPIVTSNQSYHVPKKDEVNNIEEQDEESMGKKKKVTKKFALLRLIIILLFVIGLAYGSTKVGEFLGNTILGTPEEKNVKVPTLIGCNQKEAEHVLENEGLILGEVHEIADDSKPIGYVVKQSPVEGYGLKRGASVDIWISIGGKMVSVPDVTSQGRIDMAKYQIETAGLIFTQSGEKSNVVAEGKIIRQKPAGGEMVAEGTEVVVFVSEGPENGGLIKVPSVVDLTEEEARKQLDDSKLIATVRYDYNSSKKDGVVVEQVPAADAMVSELSEVAIVVNKYKDETAPTPTQTVAAPTATPTKSPTEGKKAVQIDLSRAEEDTFTVKVVQEGQLVGGRRVQYEYKHSRNEGSIVVYVTDAPGAMLKVYFDEKLMYEIVMN